MPCPRPVLRRQSEQMELEKQVEMVGNIEDWLFKLLKHMQHAVNGASNFTSTMSSAALGMLHTGGGVVSEAWGGIDVLNTST